MTWQHSQTCLWVAGDTFFARSGSILDDRIDLLTVNSVLPGSEEFTRVDPTLPSCDPSCSVVKTISPSWISSPFLSWTSPTNMAAMFPLHLLSRNLEGTLSVAFMNYIPSYYDFPLSQ